MKHIILQSTINAKFLALIGFFLGVGVIGLDSLISMLRFSTQPMYLNGIESLFAFASWCSWMGLSAIVLVFFQKKQGSQFPYAMDFERFKEEPQMLVRDFIAFNQNCIRELARIKKQLGIAVADDVPVSQEILTQAVVAQNKTDLTVLGLIPSFQNHAVLEEREGERIDELIRRAKSRKSTYQSK